jgi:hypothetical protein
MRGGHGFPPNSHTVFETYIDLRLNRDGERIQRRYGATVPELRATAEAAAYCMAADQALGLSPSRAALAASLVRLGVPADGRLGTLLDALVFIKLAQSNQAMGEGAGGDPDFTFAHRRFQEYFATCVVLRKPDLVNAEALLSNARWRETAVVLCQTQSTEALVPLLAVAEGSLEGMAKEAYVTAGLGHSRARPFAWPAGALHLLSILQDGFAGRMPDLPDRARALAGTVVGGAYETGTLPDRKWALDVAGVVPAADLLEIMRSALSSRSRWIRDAALRQIGRLAEIPENLAMVVRTTLLRMGFEGTLRKDRTAVRAQLMRLPNARAFLRVERRARWLPLTDLMMVGVAGEILLLRGNRQHFSMSTVLLVSIVVLTGFFMKLWAADGFGLAAPSAALDLDFRRPIRERIVPMMGAMYMRTVLLLFWLLWLRARPTPGRGVLTVPLLCALPCATWGFLAVFATIRNGSGVAGWLPVLAIRGAKRLARLRPTGADVREWLGLIAGVLGISVGAGAAVTGAGAILLFAWRWLQNHFPDATRNLLHALPIVAGAAAVIILGGAAASYTATAMLDRKRSRSFLANAKGSCRLSELLGVLKGLRLNSSRLRILSEVRSGSMLVSTPDTADQLKGVISTYEREVGYSYGQGVFKWLRSLVWGDRPIASWGQDVADDLSRLLEQVQAKGAE